MFIQFQNIVFKEYLPVIVGPQMIEEYDLKIDNGQTKYNPEQDPSVGNEFATVSVFAIHCICLCPIDLLYFVHVDRLHFALVTPKYRTSFDPGSTDKSPDEAFQIIRRNIF